MGIPRLYSIIKSQWPSIIEQPIGNETCDVLLLDMSSFLYSCLSLASDEASMIDHVKQFVRRLLAVTRPQRSVFMAFDGVPPLAKLKEQYERRKQTVSKHGLNPHILTPGTEFMLLLEKKVVEFSRMLVLDSKDSSFKVVISGPKVTGEGEQKVMRHIESLPKESTKKVVIYGMDADLIVMNMPIARPDVYILREHAQSRGLPIASKKFEFFSIPRLRAKIQLNYPIPTDEKINGIMRDLGFLFTLFGNDFVPAPARLELLSSTFMKYVDMVRRVHLKNKSLVQHGEIQYGGFSLLLSDMAKEEHRCFKADNPISKSYLGTRVLELQLAGMSLSEKSSTVKSFTDQVEDDRFLKWRESYYTRNYKGRASNIKEICNEYINAISWVTRYYSEGYHSSWAYNQEFSPMISDLLLNCKGIAVQDTSMEPVNITPRHQLALVLPMESELLPPAFTDDSQLSELLSKRSIDPYFFQRENVQKVVDAISDIDGKPSAKECLQASLNDTIVMK